MQLNSELLSLLANGGAPLLVFVIWLMTFKLFSRQQERAFKEHQETVERLFKTIDADIKYKESLTAILSRMEMKIDFGSAHKQSGNKYD